MKKAFILTTLTLMATTLALSNPVNREHARQIAISFLISQGAKDANLIEPIDSPIPQLHIFNAPTCFAILSSNDACHPVLGYSTDSPIDINNISPSTHYWLNEYANQIAFAETHNIQASADIANEWKRLCNGQPLPDKYSESVKSLLTTKWGQGYPYNAKCPTINGNHTVPTGCVATAMAQVMRYWQWPLHGKGYHSYSYEDNPNAVADWLFGDLSFDFENTTFDWDNMPDTLKIASGEQAIEAVSTLMYACGVAFDMMYKESSSGAFLLEENVLYDTSLHIPIDAAVEYRAAEFLDYAESMAGEMRMDYSDDEWTLMMKENLSDSMPMIYVGFKFNDEGIAEGGHAFVIDGYNKPGYFHVNWGWDGNANGFFGISALNVENYGYSFNDRQGTIFNMKPSIYQSISPLTPTSSKFKTYTQGRQIVIKEAEGQTATIYDSMGQLIISTTLHSNKEQLSMPHNGLYIVRIGNHISKVLCN